MKHNLIFTDGMSMRCASGRALTTLAAALLVAGAQQTVSAAAFSLTGSSGTYIQNFDSLGTTSGTWTNDSTLPSWFAIRTGTGTSITVSTGSSSGGDLYNFGSASAIDRALGSIGSSNAAAGSFAWGAYFENDTGAVIDSIKIGYTGEQWRSGGGGTGSTDRKSVV